MKSHSSGGVGLRGLFMRLLLRYIQRLRFQGVKSDRSVREVLLCMHIGKEVLTETLSFWFVLYQHRRV